MKTLTLQECKDIIAQKDEFKDFNEAINSEWIDKFDIETFLNETATLFAEQDKWVSVEEKPKTGTWVQPLFKEGVAILPVWYSKESDSWFQHSTPGNVNDKIIGWQPLPAASKV